MKICTKCGKSCFDNEVFCAYCGENLGVKQFQCNYCGTFIKDLKVKQCPNCNAPVSYDTYSKSKHMKTCDSCSNKIPVYAKYCSYCGKKEAATRRIAIITLIIISLCIMGIILPLSLTLERSKDKSEETVQTYTERVEAEATDREKLKEESETAVYRKMTVDELYEQYDTIKEGDWLELTGRIKRVDKGIALSIIECVNITSENKDCEIQIQAYNRELGNSFYENCEKGQIVTIKANVDTLYSLIKKAAVIYFEYERVD